MKLYLIRHGQTLWNREGRIQGRTDIALSEEGLHQARLLAAAMDDRPVEQVFSSPLKRAYSTARILAERQGCPLKALEGLEEVGFGLWEGLTWQEIAAAYPEDFSRWDKNPSKQTPTGGEEKEHSQKRCGQAMEAILSEARGDTAIVAHGGILVFAGNWLLKEDKTENEIILKNASITTIDYDPVQKKGTLLFLNDVSHLKNGGKLMSKINKLY